MAGLSRGASGRAKFEQRQFKAFDELRHEREIESIDGVTRKMVVRIPEEGRIGDHDRRQACIPERGVIAQAGFGQNPSVEGEEQRRDR